MTNIERTDAENPIVMSEDILNQTSIMLVNTEYMETINGIIDTVLVSVDEKKVPTTSAIPVLINIMELVEATKTLKKKSDLKKTLTISSLQIFVNRTKGVERVPQSLVQSVEGILGNQTLLEDMIDDLVAATKGKFRIQRTIMNVLKCLPICLGPFL